MKADPARHHDLRPHVPHLAPGDVVDADVDLHDPAQRAETRPREWDLLAAIAVGGVLGAEARYGVGVLVPNAGDAFPWATLLVNVTGSLLIGVLMVALHELGGRAHRLARPFLGVGVLGGYTTFSTFGVDAVGLVRAHEPLLALGYVLATVVLCLAGVTAATLAVQTAAARRRGARAAEPVR